MKVGDFLCSTPSLSIKIKVKLFEERSTIFIKIWVKLFLELDLRFGRDFIKIKVTFFKDQGQSF